MSSGTLKQRYVFGPVNEPSEPGMLMDLDAAKAALTEYFNDCDHGDEIVFRVEDLTDEEVEALPDV